MEHVREHVDLTKVSKEDVIKINAVRKNKGVCLPHEELGACGRSQRTVEEMNQKLVA